MSKQITVDDEVYKLLKDIKKDELPKETSNTSNSNAIRWLANKSNFRELMIKD